MANPQDQDTKSQTTKKQENGDGCPPGEVKNPDEKWKCWNLPELPDGPKLDPRTPCPERCDYDCKCPTKPGSTASCFDELIREQTELLNKAATAKQFKDELQGLLDKATVARQNYSPKKYTELLEIWTKQNKDIEALVDKIPCHVSCWKCLIRCEICPLIYDIRDMQRELEGVGDPNHEAKSLRDQHYWYSRLRYSRESTFNRIKDVLKAWEDPSKSIEKNLNDNRALIDKIDNSTLCSEPVDAIFDIFVKLVPMHLAIGPRTVVEPTNETDVKTYISNSNIEKWYLDICGCDSETPDECCGPNVGVPTVIEQLIGPQAYIVEPDKYFDILCCLATRRYIPAKKHLDAAIAKLAVVEEEIKKYEVGIPKKKKELFQDYRASVIVPVDCSKYLKPKDNGDTNPKDDCDDGEKPSQPPAPTAS